jgi:hypothetical protein
VIRRAKAIEIQGQRAGGKRIPKFFEQQLRALLFFTLQALPTLDRVYLKDY